MPFAAVAADPDQAIKDAADGPPKAAWAKLNNKQRLSVVPKELWPDAAAHELVMAGTKFNWTKKKVAHKSSIQMLLKAKMVYVTHVPNIPEVVAGVKVHEGNINAQGAVQIGSLRSDALPFR